VHRSSGACAEGGQALAQAEALANRLRQGGLCLTAEVDPPRGTDLNGLLDRVRKLAPLVDAVNVTDGSRARVRLAGLFAAAAIRQQLQVEVIAHLTTRDRNRIALQADLLGAAAFGLRTVLAVTGDAPGDGDEPEARAVGDVDTAAMIRLVSALNAGRTASGVALEGHTQFLIGCGANPGAEDLPKELDKLAQRIQAGVGFVQTQPVFDLQRALAFADAVRDLGVPVLYGILPLRSAERARYFQRIPGMSVPQGIIDRLETGGEQEGLAIAAEMAVALAPHVPGLHLFPMGSQAALRAIADVVAPWRRGAD